jgi:hypothetical protein
MGRESLQCLCFVASVALVLGGIVGVFMLMDYLGDLGAPVGVLVLIFLVGVSAALTLCMLSGRKNGSSAQVSTPTEASISAEPVFVPVTILQITKGGGMEAV